MVNLELGGVGLGLITDSIYFSSKAKLPHTYYSITLHGRIQNLYNGGGLKPLVNTHAHKIVGRII